jgi:pimeloyl-ACP methyl ester carboxylesterase
MLRIALAALLGATGVAVVSAPASAFDVKEIGSFHVGGQDIQIVDFPNKEIQVANGGPLLKYNVNGDFVTGQMYVQYVKLRNAKAKYPLLLWHTGGATGASWETKPDGRPGWQQYFLNAGHDVYVSDAVERGRASWSRYPEVFKSEPYFRDKKEAWEIFRIGAEGSYNSDPAKRVANPGQQFPVDAFGQLNKQIVPRWATNNDAIQAGYNALVAKVCPCVIMAHGQAGGFAVQAALTAPDKVKGIIAIETPYPPEADKTDIRAMKAIPQIFVWGDNIDTVSYWKNAYSGRPRAYFDAVKKLGANVEWLDLPAVGIKGNTHMVMMDNNSDVVASRMQDWMTKNGLMQK